MGPVAGPGTASLLAGPPPLHHEKLLSIIPRPSRLNPDSLSIFLSQPQRGGPDTWLKSFKTVFPKYLSDWQMEMLYAGAGGERIGNKMKDAKKNINSVGGQDGAWRCFSASLFLKLVVRPAKMHLFVHSLYPAMQHLLSVHSAPSTGPGARPSCHAESEGHLWKLDIP